MRRALYDEKITRKKISQIKAINERTSNFDKSVIYKRRIYVALVDKY